MTYFPLHTVPAGKRVRLQAIEGGKQVSRRLKSLGISLGGELEVINRRGQGVVVGYNGCRVALGHGIADKLRVEMLD